jgi:hypothetical protein
MMRAGIPKLVQVVSARSRSNEINGAAKHRDPEAGMGRCRGIEHRRDWQIFPEGGSISDTCGQGIERNIAERMVDEMTQQVENWPTRRPTLQIYLSSDARLSIVMVPTPLEI